MLRSTYNPPPPLPPGWSEHRAPSGHLYYYNASTKQSTYKRPQSQDTQNAQTSAPVLPVAGSTHSLPFYSPETLPPFSSTPYGPAGFSPGSAQHSQTQHKPGNTGGGSRGGRRYQDRGQREARDRPKSKHPIPHCAPWVLVKTKLGRRFVHNPETNESFWKFPEKVLKGVVEYDRLEREKQERVERGDELEQADETKKGATEALQPSNVSGAGTVNETHEGISSHARDSEEYEEVEVTDDEDDDEEHGQVSKRARTESPDKTDQPLEFTEEDMDYQLAAMGEDYGLEPGEYGEPGDDWEEGAEGLPLTEADAEALFRDLLDDYRVNPFSTWEKILEEGRIIDDSRYTAPENMRTRREIFSRWSKDRIKDVQARKEQQEKEDPRIKYLAFLEEFATPKLYWPEFKRKYRKEADMRNSQLSDKDREKLYRDYVAKLKLPESTRKTDLSALLKAVPLHALNRLSNCEALPSMVVTDVRYIAVPRKIRTPLIEAFISTLPPPPEQQMTAEQQEEHDRKQKKREKRERALADREKRVEEDKRRQRGELLRGKHLLREGEAEIAEAMKVRKDGLRAYMEIDDPQPSKIVEDPSHHN
ncbi:Uncharacterized protein PECH_008699 [Penicillium ucsense]|uniref:WW domain-containing protein n=1 Tax=Penicillium ucsense TaxID=2839758 RepID=A0A8J8W578_9EURO|nr:Uncharacterized protein PECM_006130 [Penicillium ucsense]KAF7734039.1 Uncharacterized protein PECH_008699 [Penicillium ucsense]